MTDKDEPILDKYARESDNPETKRLLKEIVKVNTFEMPIEQSLQNLAQPVFKCFSHKEIRAMSDDELAESLSETLTIPTQKAIEFEQRRRIAESSKPKHWLIRYLTHVIVFLLGILSNAFAGDLRSLVSRLFGF